MLVNNLSNQGEDKMKLFFGGPSILPIHPTSGFFSFVDNKPLCRDELYKFLSISYYRQFFCSDKREDFAMLYKQTIGSLQEDQKLWPFVKDEKIHKSSIFENRCLLPSKYIAKELEGNATKSVLDFVIYTIYQDKLKKLKEFSEEQLINEIENLSYKIIDAPFSSWEKEYPDIEFTSMFTDGEFIEIYPKTKWSGMLQNDDVIKFFKEQEEWVKEQSCRPSFLMGMHKTDYQELREYKGKVFKWY